MRLFLVLISVMFLVVGCQSKQQINKEKLVILKRLGVENKYVNYKEITEKGTVLKIKALFKKEG
ncbi:hypothetical protein [Paenibacillus glycanilyticus]|uniref:Lipoprotein n=1 Tax=Paenibacillus glycanilyticus TaxID=126569 RepID=A0ABQ6GC53_9BACL|nr:hypothetical protein [Paenibacillus glycanilyticus]GLX66881.1 hypothetical protein MU1_12250 [Paenibacillus glycanilyticus]